tara:strand:+ start:1456 stop:2061 length:606 start_codon:yes stop_codon:yes gene_type:complete
MNCDMMFGVPLFRYYVDPTELKKMVKERFETDLPINAKPDGWDCNLKTDFSNSFEHLYTHFYDDVMEQFSKDVGLEDSVAMIHESWVNYYVRDSNQEEHDHIPSFYSGIHYIKYDPEIHEAAAFMNPLAQLYTMTYSERSEDDAYDFSKQQFSPGVGEGDVVLFPSFLRHRVPKQQTDEPRITSSFNINTIKGSTRRVFSQ